MHDTAVRSLNQSAGRHTGLAHHQFLEALKGAGRRVAANHNDRSLGTADFIPGTDLASEDVLELSHRQALDGIVRIDDRNDGVMGNRVTHGLDVVIGEVLDFLILHVARSHRNVGHAVAQRLNAVARSGTRDRHGDVRIGLHEALRRELHSGQNRRRAVNRNGFRVNGGGSGKTSESAENGNHVFSHFQLPTSRDVFGVRFLFRTGRSMKVGFDSAVNLL